MPTRAGSAILFAVLAIAPVPGQAGLQHLVPRTGPSGAEVRVALGDDPVDLVLQPVSLRAERFVLQVDDGRGFRALPAPPPTTYRGTLRGRDGTVAASIDGGRIFALVHTGGATWVIQPAGRAHAVVRHHAAPRAPLRCGHVPAAGTSVAPLAPAGSSSNVFEAELAIDVDHEFLARHGGSVVATLQAVERVLNPVDEVFRRDVGIRYRITTVIVRTQPLYTSPGVAGRLSELQTHWNRNHATTPRDVVHLFSGLADPNLYGIANLGSVCDRASAYAVSSAFQPLHVDNVVLVAHELGHAWNAPHCLSFPCYIMCPLLGCASAVRFGVLESAPMIAYRDLQTCLRVIPAGAFAPYGSGCPGSAGVPRLVVAGRPVLGQTCSVGLTSARPSTAALLLLGRSDADWNGIRLPWSLAPLGAPGCAVLASGDLVVPVQTDGAGVAAVPLGLPRSPELFGISVYAQWLVADPGANPLGVAASGAVAATLGDR